MIKPTFGLPMNLTMGSACAGMLTSAFAPRLLCGRYKLSHEWWCESEPLARRFIDNNFPGIANFDDVLSAEWIQSAPAVDILDGGFPCTPSL